ncbi:hypothetical protein TYRP_004081 [Tyrophagus putrescentiae]|nr:hypothetical protein TYRP_004081 [Tyrophagus putrescentiae]
MGLRGSQERATAWLIVAAAASEPSSLTSTTALCRTWDNFKRSPPSPPLPVIRLKSAASSNAASMPIHRSVGFSSSEDSILKRGSDRVTFRAVILEYPLCRLRKSKKDDSRARVQCSLNQFAYFAFGLSAGPLIDQLGCLLRLLFKVNLEDLRLEAALDDALISGQKRSLSGLQGNCIGQFEAVDGVTAGQIVKLAKEGVEGGVALRFSQLELNSKDRVGVEVNVLVEVNLATAPDALDHISRLLTYHDDGGVGVAADNFRHDGAVGDAQSADALHPQLRIDDGGGVVRSAHFAGAHRVVDGGGQCLRHALHVLVAVEGVSLTAGHHQLAGHRFVALSKGRRRGEHVGKGHRLGHRLQVVGVGKVVGVDERLVVGIATAQRQVAAAARLQQHRQDGVALGAHKGLKDLLPHLLRQADHLGEAPAVIYGRSKYMGETAGEKVNLVVGQIGQRPIGVRGAHKAHRIEAAVAGDRPPAHGNVGDEIGQRVHPCLNVRPELALRSLSGRHEVQPIGEDVVLKVLAHREVGDDRHADAIQDDLLAGKDLVAAAEAVKDDANRLAVLIEEHLGDVRKGDHVEVASVADAVEVGLGGGTPATAANGRLRNEKAVLVGAIGVQHWVACLPGLEKGVRQLAHPGGPLYGKWATASVVSVEGDIRVAIVLRLDEVRQDVLVAPAGGPAALPLRVLEPPRTFPRGQFRLRPSMPKQDRFCGTVRYCQSMGVCWMRKMPCGTSVTALSEPPASSSSTFTRGFSDRRLAMTQPAEPAPTTM